VIAKESVSRWSVSTCDRNGEKLETQNESQETHCRKRKDTRTKKSNAFKYCKMLSWWKRVCL